MASIERERAASPTIRERLAEFSAAFTHPVTARPDRAEGGTGESASPVTAGVPGP